MGGVTILIFDVSKRALQLERVYKCIQRTYTTFELP
jgi:hypothetical protein